jgi:hypothetical protein
MLKSESIAEITKAICKMQSELKPASKSCKNPLYNSKYADLNEIWDIAKEPLSKNGLALIQGAESVTDGTNNYVRISSILSHISGEWFETHLDIVPIPECIDKANGKYAVTPQSVGKCIMYGRRYGMSALLGVVSEEDDDGNQSSGKVDLTKPVNQTLPPKQDLTKQVSNPIVINGKKV